MTRGSRSVLHKGLEDGRCSSSAKQTPLDQRRRDQRPANDLAEGIRRLKKYANTTTIEATSIAPRQTSLH
jgi:hypothetical protein